MSLRDSRVVRKLATIKGFASIAPAPVFHAPDQPAQLARLHQFIVWIFTLNTLFAVIEALAWLLFHDLASGFVSGVILLGSGVVGLARHQVLRGNLEAAVTTICATLLGADIVVVFLQPLLLPALTCIPLLAMALALPYVGGRTMRRLVVLAWITTVVVVVGSHWPLLPSRLPNWFIVDFRVSSATATVTLVLLLLWQFSSRLHATLGRTRAAEERYSLAARGANDGLWDWDLTTNQVYYSPRWKEMLGWGEADISNTADEWLNRVHPDDRARVSSELAVHRDGLTKHFESEHRMLSADGQYRWMLTRGIAVVNATGQPTRMAGSQTDITDRKQVENKLLHDAFHDALTGLPNRALFLDRLERAIVHSKRHPNYRYAVLFIDLDRFKHVNDSLGHSAGDRLLQILSQRLQACLRPNDTVARLGGDEFAILIDAVADAEWVTLVTDRLLRQMHEPFQLENTELFSSISVGVALPSSTYEQPEQVLRDADIALYRAKALGRNRYEVFTASMHERAVAVLQLEMDLRRAIEREEFVVYYQPIIALENGRIAGFEALIRWQHPQRGLLSPSDFIEVAEETGMIVPMGWFVLREACRQLRLWDAHFLGRTPLTMSVNVSGSQFCHPDLISNIGTIFREIATDPSRLNLEITENVMMADAESTSQVLARLQAMDIRLQMDDFGTGYSSLSALQRLPLDALKIDRSFVSQICSADDQNDLIQTIVTLAQNAKLSIIAEGVETTEQLNYLRKGGCTYVQGYLFSKPVDARLATELIARDQRW
ncbi:MAG: hypothetical protein NVS4B8_05360 [Herpetosiphon sp.]